MKVNSTWLLFLSLVLITGSLSCKISEKTTPQNGRADRSPEDQKKSDKSTIAGTLDKYRSHLNDVYATQRHDYPEIFNTHTSANKKGKADFRGFRIQLVSTRNVSIADSAQARFQRWLKNHPTSYRPTAYIIFRQPYYRVHVGDFQQREKAIQYSRLIKEQFPSAWVVHDRIKPKRAPADTMKIFIQDTVSTSSDSLATASDSLKVPQPDTLRR